MLLLSLVCALSLFWLSNAGDQSIEQQPLFEEPPAWLQGSRLNFSSPAPHIFSSAHGLLRQGYNTFFPNGFSVAPCEIPTFTPFYHGWLNDDPPESPEWLASTPEMAYGIMGSTRNSFLSIYQTTRPAKCLYFDGASGALGENGTMDTQMLFLYGNTTGPPGKNSSVEFMWDEYARAQRLCGWLHDHNFDAPGQGIEAIIRMSAGFEVIWCNFSSPSLQLVYRLNVSVPLLEYNRTSSVTTDPDNDKNSSFSDEEDPVDLPAPDWEIDWEHEPFVASQQWDWFTSNSKTYNLGDLASKREPSIRLLDVDLVSLYSPEYQQLLSTLVEREREQFNLTSDGFWRGVSGWKSRRDALENLTRRRARHRVGDLSPQESVRFRQDVEQMVSRVFSYNSHNSLNLQHFPWSRICDAIVDGFAKRLMQFQRLLQHDNSAGRKASLYTKRRFALLRERAHALLMPFFEYSSDGTTQIETKGQSNGAEASVYRCKRAYLPVSFRNEANDVEPEVTGHHVVSQAIEEVLDSICSALVGAGTSIEKAWLRNFNHNRRQIDVGEMQRLHIEMQRWKEKIEELTAWLGWAPHWMSCDRICAWDEECYIPMWPVLRQLSPERPAYGNNPIDPEEVEYDLWHPRCLKITDFAARQKR